MYINRKTGERVEAKLVDEHILAVRSGDYWELKMAGEYGEAMICPLKKCCHYNSCPLAKPHICGTVKMGTDDVHYDCPDCIPYIPEQKPKKDKLTESFEQMMIDTFNVKFVDVTPSQKQADEEPVFPVCGTCNAQKDAYLLLPPEKIRDILQTGGTPFDFSMEIARAELDHLAELGIVYVSRQVKCDECDGTGEVKVWENEGEDYCMEGCAFCGSKGFYLVYIPLSDYMKQMEAKE